MAKKIREQSISLISYLEKVKDDDISDNQDVQRLFCWDNNAINELIVTVLTDDYIPPLILGEIEFGDGLVQQYIVDGMQRSSALIKFRYANYKISASIEDSIIKYQRKKRDENNKACKDEEGNLIWEYVQFDIKGKTFEMLPYELKKKFDDYQVKIAIHQNCTMEQISKLVRRYNNHKAMGVSQKAFTYIDKFARKIRSISQSDFFRNCINYSDTERVKGTYERLVCESVMSTCYLEKWKKQPKQMSIFLNDNASIEDFNLIEEYAGRLEKVCADKFMEFFVLKDICVWFSLFHKFTKFGISDSKFAEFMTALKDELHDKEISGLSYDSLSKEKNTKDKRIISNKIETLYTLMTDYLNIDNSEPVELNERETLLDFVRNNVFKGITNEDLEFYRIVLDDLTVEVDNNSKLLEQQNIKSLTALVAYSSVKDIDLEEWIADYFKRNTTYYKNQKENYLYMVKDLNHFIKRKGEVA